MKKDFDINNLVRGTVKHLEPYSSARDEYSSNGSQMIFLDANENPFENGVNRYPDPQQHGLKSILARKKGVKVNNILLGNGSDEVLDLIFRSFCEPDVDNIITLPPTYGMYKVLAGINAVENREILLKTDFEPDVAEILKSADNRTKIVFLCSPNNPTGNSFSKDYIQEILENFSGLVVIDEAYIDFSKSPGWVPYLSQYPNLIIVQTLSKAYGMAGIRLGICYASKAIITVLNKIKPPYNVNELTQKKALQGITDHGPMRQEVDTILKERELFTKSLAEIGFVEKIHATDANFVLVKVDNADRRYHQLLGLKVVVRNRSTQPLCENTLRFTIGTPEENQKVVSLLKTIKK